MNRQTAIYVLPVLILLSVLAGCRKKEYYHFSTDLAIDSRIIQVAALADTTRIIVYSDGDWTMTAEQPVTWATLLTTSGSGKGEVTVGVQDNSTNLPRSVKLLVKAGSKTDTISLQQKGITPGIVITDATANGIANGGIIKTAITTNVPLALMTKSFRYVTDGQTGWITDLDIKDGYLYFKIGQNQAPAARVGVLQLSYLDALGITTKDSIVITQNMSIDYTGAVSKDFAYVKQALAAGPITENIFIEGIVVSDKGNPNMAKNLNTTANKHVLDKTENAIAVYIQSLDGLSGLYIKTKTAGDNLFYFNDHVKVWLKGATLEKYSNPGRAVIKGIESMHIMSKEENSVLLPREKYMNALTDEDLYTYVKLKQVEIAIPSGAFTNINEGYTARMDCYPTSIRDINGSSMYMLTNLDVPYRRDGNRVPQGSGDITGVLVYETLERYGTNIGRYSIRPLQRNDIALNNDRSAGFSNVLVEWSRFKTEYNAAPTQAANPLTPDIGAGRLFMSNKTNLDFTANGIPATNDYNGLIQEPATVKGSVSNGGWGSKNWWNNTTNKGEYWGIEVSTAGITKPISLQVEGNTDIGGPRNFIVEWSTANDDNGTWNTVGTFTLEDVANFSNTLLTQVAGFKVINFEFPQAASGLASLYIRIRVANKTVGTATSVTGGTLTATTASRLGHISIKYNK